MKICYHILEKHRTDIPQEHIFKIFHEERTKWIMNLVDKNDDIQRLEEIFAVEVIEHFIESLAGQLEMIDLMKHLKPWEKTEDYSVDTKYLDDVFTPEQKFPKYQRSERVKKEFVDL